MAVPEYRYSFFPSLRIAGEPPGHVWSDASRVLISGMRALGAEIAKNLVLAGVKSVTLHDEGTVEWGDLCGKSIFSENDLGQNRALASVQKLRELNDAVVVFTITTRLTKEHLSFFQAVVLTDIDFEQAYEFNDYCRSHAPPIAFIRVLARGLYGSVFCDFGPNSYSVIDVNGEEAHKGTIVSISSGNPALVSCKADERLEFRDGDLVVFSGIDGMAQLNDGKPRKIKSAQAYSFMLEEDTSNYAAYEGHGIVTLAKKSTQKLGFKPLREAVHHADFLISDYATLGRPPLLHIAFEALDKFVTTMMFYPVAGNEQHALQFRKFVAAINEGLRDSKLVDVNTKLLNDYLFCSGKVADQDPEAAMYKKIVEKVVEACSGKFHPLFQCSHYDAEIIKPWGEPRLPGPARNALVALYRLEGELRNGLIYRARFQDVIPITDMDHVDLLARLVADYGFPTNKVQLSCLLDNGERLACALKHGIKHHARINRRLRKLGLVDLEELHVRIREDEKLMQG